MTRVEKIQHLRKIVAKMEQLHADKIQAEREGDLDKVILKKKAMRIAKAEYGRIANQIKRQSK